MQLNITKLSDNVLVYETKSITALYSDGIMINTSPFLTVDDKTGKLVYRIGDISVCPDLDTNQIVTRKMVRDKIHELEDHVLKEHGYEPALYIGRLSMDNFHRLVSVYPESEISNPELLPWYLHVDDLYGTRDKFRGVKFTRHVRVYNHYNMPLLFYKGTDYNYIYYAGKASKIDPDLFIVARGNMGGRCGFVRRKSTNSHDALDANPHEQILKLMETNVSRATRAYLPKELSVDYQLKTINMNGVIECQFLNHKDLLKKIQELLDKYNLKLSMMEHYVDNKFTVEEFEELIEPEIIGDD